MYSPKEIVDNISSMIVVSTLMSLITVPIIVFIALKYFFLMKAIILNLSAWIMLPIMDGFAKYLSSSIPVCKLLGLGIFLRLLSFYP